MTAGRRQRHEKRCGPPARQHDSSFVDHVSARSVGGAGRHRLAEAARAEPVFLAAPTSGWPGPSCSSSSSNDQMRKRASQVSGPAAYTWPPHTRRQLVTKITTGEHHPLDVLKSSSFVAQLLTACTTCIYRPTTFHR